MIRVVYTIYEDDDLANVFMPKYVCDTCNEMIDHLSQGILVYYPVRAEGVTLEAKVVHKGKCDLTNREYPNSRGWWYELDQVAELMRADDERWREGEPFALGDQGPAGQIEPDISKFNDTEMGIIQSAEAKYSESRLKLMEHYIIRSYTDYPNSDNTQPLTSRSLRLLRAVWVGLLDDIPTDLFESLYKLAKQGVAEEAADPDREAKWREKAMEEAMFYAEHGQSADLGFGSVMGGFRKKPCVTGLSMRVTWNLNKERFLRGDLE